MPGYHVLSGSCRVRGFRFQGRGAEGSYERLFLAERVGLDRTYEPWFWFFDLYVSVRVLLYMVVSNVHMSMRTIHVAKQKVVWKSDPCVLEPVPSYPAGMPQRSHGGRGTPHCLDVLAAQPRCVTLVPQHSSNL